MKKLRKVLALCVTLAIFCYWKFRPDPFISPSVLHALQYQLRHQMEKRDNFTIPLEDQLTKEMMMPLEFAKEPHLDPRQASDTNLKKILMWNEFYGMTHMEVGLGQEPFIRAGCPINTCWLSANRSLFKYTELDAVIWYAGSSDTSFPEYRSPHTRYIFFLLEPPGILQQLWISLPPYTNIFNWTLTYRLDSDIPIPYGHVMKLRERDKNWINLDFSAGKSKMVAWFVSNCNTQSGRHRVVNTLQQYIEVDIYGKCGTLSCGTHHRNWKCYEMLDKHYKFYLAFENNLCLDYVTEKLFNILDMNVIPIVYGGADYKHLLPPHSYIDVMEFPDIKSLADYLLYLHANDTAYNQYFEWKQYYQVVTRWASRMRTWCRLCEKLHTQPTSKIYPDMHDWFYTKGQCKVPSD
ncbi:hypothetical protein OTU49_003707 [Cherax quadricarinatus]|uniref:Fucosyltransferase n=2 Tax=Cherax quadricarinatus TaxID=27406 RepID=A0AAW0XGH3_CHEQU